MMAVPDKTIEEAEECGEIDFWQEFINLFMNCHSCFDFDRMYHSPDFYYCPVCFVEQTENGFNHKDPELIKN